MSKTESKLRAAGWELAGDDKPGIYVRSQELIKNDPLDWVSKPTELLREFEAEERQVTTPQANSCA